MSESTRTLTVPPGARGETGTTARSGRAIVWVFLAPTLIGLGLFNLVPIVGSFVLAFFRWDIISDPVFVGVDNFVDLAMNPTVRVSFLNTIGFVIVAVILQLTVALVLAILVQSKLSLIHI